MSDLIDILPRIRARAQRYDVSGDWPADDLNDLAAAGAMRAALPRDAGGTAESSLDIHLRYEQIATASLATSLVLSQRDSACTIIDTATRSPIRRELLAALCDNSIFTTVGIAQLTTSRQGGTPAVRAQRIDANGRRGWQIDGVVPWASGADASKYVVAGAVVDGAANPSSGERSGGADSGGEGSLGAGAGKQILFALPTDAPGVSVAPPMPLVALQSTHTAAVGCESVFLDDRFLLHGPVPNALAAARSNFGKPVPIGQAFMATGLARGAIDLIREHNSDLARSAVDSFEPQLADVRADVLKLCEADASTPPDFAAIATVRGRCNELALRITQSAVAIYKGTALLADHPAQRLAREAMFLLVWSCPNPVIDCTVGLLADGSNRG